MMAGIDLQSVLKTFPNGTRAVDGVDLTIHDGEFMVLVGPSGCGKTTLLRCIAGLEDVTDGAIFIGGRDVTDVDATQGELEAIELPRRLQPSVAYAATVVRGTEHAAEARAFIHGLLAGPGAKALRVAGFEPPPH